MVILATTLNISFLIKFLSVTQSMNLFLNSDSQFKSCAVAMFGNNYCTSPDEFTLIIALFKYWFYLSLYFEPFWAGIKLIYCKILECIKWLIITEYCFSNFTCLSPTNKYKIESSSRTFNAWIQGCFGFYWLSIYSVRFIQ